MIRTTAPVSTSPTRARLLREWNRLATRPDAVRAAARWSITATPPASLDEVLAAVGDGGDRSREADRRLRELVAIARHDELAARVVVERLAPGLITLAYRYRGNDGAFEELLAAAWIAVRTYNPDRSPSNIAVALLSDTEYGAYRRGFRRRDHVERPAPLPDQLAAAEHRHPADELAELLDDASAAGMRSDDVDLVRQLVTTPDAETLARAHNVTSRTIRNRRDRAVASLRELALAG